ncbi:MAG: hypothetical protein B6I34_11660, partial [Anaerolineaceae bacterium 4572_32.1]
MMFSDVLTVMWKERKGLLRYQGSRTRSLLGLLIPVAMLGIYLPLQIGRALVEGPWSLVASVFIPMMLAQKEAKLVQGVAAHVGPLIAQLLGFDIVQRPRQVGVEVTT